MSPTERVTGIEPALSAWELDAKQARELLGFLCEMQQLTWGEILSQTTGGRDRHKKHHSQDASSLTGAARKRLAELEDRFEDELAELFRFRLGGETRLWGVRQGDTFHLIWFDPYHAVCPVSK